MKVLVVDDSKAMRMIVTRTLRQINPALQLVEATNGVEALKVYAEQRPDLILSDWNMPEMTGIELLKKLKATTPTVKLGFVTSESSAEMQNLATTEGALFLLTKPFTPDSMKTVVGPYLIK